MRGLVDFMYCVPAVALLAMVLRLGGFQVLPVFLLPLLGVYLLGRVHGYRSIEEHFRKLREQEKKAAQGKDER